MVSECSEVEEEGRRACLSPGQVEWDKGHALAHLLAALGLEGSEDVLPIYVGDDRTDEDAFRLLAACQRGFGILVSSRVGAAALIYQLLLC